MRSSIYITAIYLLVFVSCDSHIDDLLDDLSGTWKLVEMSYINSQGVSETISNSSTMLVLTKEIAGGADVDGVRKGIQDVGDEEFRFEYSLDFSQGYIDIMYKERSDQEALPIDAIGRVQVYQFEQIDQSHIEFFVAEEIDHAKGEFEPLTNIRYIFEKQ